MATTDDKDKKIGEVPHLEELTGREKIPVSADGEPRYIEVKDIIELGVLPDGVSPMPADNQIVYVTTDGKKCEISGTLSNRYYPTLGFGVIERSSNFTSSPSFYGMKNLQKVVLPSTITELGKEVFRGCSSLESINLPEGLTKIQDYCFYLCSNLKHIVFPSSLEGIGKRAFNYTGLLEVDLSKSKVFSLNNYTFQSNPQIECLKLGIISKLGDYEFYQSESLKYLKSGENVDLRISYSTGFGETPNIRLVDTYSSDIIYFPHSPQYPCTFILRRSDKVVANVDYILKHQLNNLIRVYVPETLLSAYHETYPEYKHLIHPMSGQDIYPLREDVDAKFEEIEEKISGGTSGGGVTWGKIGKKYEYVDLGLPSGLLWATCNIGASKPEDAGLYFAWGETEGYTQEQIEANNRVFDWLNYKLSINGSKTNLKKYNSNDKLTTLEPEDDAACVLWGGDWRMPTEEECKELINECNVELLYRDSSETPYAIALSSKQSSNSQRLILPLWYRANAAGGNFPIEQAAAIWSANGNWSTLYSDSAKVLEYYRYINRSWGTLGSCERYCGMPIRPVRTK